MKIAEPNKDIVSLYPTNDIFIIKGPSIDLINKKFLKNL